MAKVVLREVYLRMGSLCQLGVVVVVQQMIVAVWNSGGTWKSTHTFSFILDDGYVVSSGWDRMGGQVPEPGVGDVAYVAPSILGKRL